MRRFIAILGGLLFAFGVGAFGIELSGDLKTELATNFHSQSKLATLMRVNANTNLGCGFSLSAAAISAFHTTDHPILGDYQGFSNIETTNVPFTFPVLSLNWSCDIVTVKAGIRNMNENYFSSPLTCFFTGSSCGLVPTVAANMSIANYPISSMGIDMEFTLGRGFRLLTSVYNGTAYNHFTGRDNIFRICPKADGVMGVAEISHEGTYGQCFLGGVVRNLHNITRSVAWGYAELNLTKDWQMILQYSVAPGADVDCRHYAGVGTKTTIGKVDIGGLVNCAVYSASTEYDTEITATIPLFEGAYLQPALHYVHNGDDSGVAGIFRFGYTF